MKRMLLGVIILLLTACGPMAQPDAEEIVRRAEKALENLDRAHAVIEAEATIKDEHFHLVGEGWMQDEQSRFVVRESSESDLTGGIAVSDGETGWLYHPATKTVLTGNVEKLKAFKQKQKALPQGMDFRNLSELVDELLRVTDHELIGTETVADMETWHLRLTPNEEAPRRWVAVGGTIDLWISKELDLPLKLGYSGSEMGEGHVLVQTLDLDPTFEPDLFTFAPPEDSRIIDVSSLLPERMSLPEARDQAGFPLLSTPADSPEATLVDLYRVGEHFVQEFDGTQGSWKLWQGTLNESHHDEHQLDGGEPVTLRGLEGTLYSDEEQRWTVLTWEENGVNVKLSGRLAPETALELAETLE